MRTLSVLQPWATLLVAGKKRFDVRGWHTTYRGPLAIHAGSRFPPPSRALCQCEPYRSVLRQFGIMDGTRLPRGVILGTVGLLACTRIEELSSLPDDEYFQGDFRPGCWMWEFCDPVLLSTPVPVRGRLGLFEVPLSLETLAPGLP